MTCWTDAEDCVDLAVGLLCEYGFPKSVTYHIFRSFFIWDWPVPSTPVVCLDFAGRWYEASVVERKYGAALIHYTGWPSAWNEWVPKHRTLDDHDMTALSFVPLSQCDPNTGEVIWPNLRHLMDWNAMGEWASSPRVDGIQRMWVPENVRPLHALRGDHIRCSCPQCPLE